MTKKEYLEMASIEVDNFSAKCGRYHGEDANTAEMIFRGRIALLNECVMHEHMNTKTKELVCNRISTLAGAALMK